MLSYKSVNKAQLAFVCVTKDILTIVCYVINKTSFILKGLQKSISIIYLQRVFVFVKICV